MEATVKLRAGVFGLSGCWGEQIVILNCEDDLLALAAAVDFVDFRAVSSRNDTEGPLDVAFVEGFVGTPREETAIRKIRQRARLLVACGSCACFGGVSAGEHRPLADLVKVDAALPGCPMEKDEFLAAVAALLNGDLPNLVHYPVCAECRIREQECLLLAHGIFCSGPITAGGCGARCPGYNVPCIGCRGPADDANVASMERIVHEAGYSLEDFRRRQRLFFGEAGQ
jgi:coenzyme F420-reducing hydrogenase gamma subunit